MEPLQKFSYRDSLYLRPNQKWICGRASEGMECEIGPNARGQCIAGSECNPRKEGHRWYCTRSATHGGTCSDGPLPDGKCCLPISPPCRPVRSWRSKREITSRWLFAAILGIILLCFSQGGGGFFISPGALSTAHSNVSECGACHSAFPGGPNAWLQAAFVKKMNHKDSEACLGCHDLGRTPLRQHGITAHQHDVATPEWTGLTKNSPGAMVLLRNAAWDFLQPNNDSLTCATCHEEHQGTMSNLNTIRNQTCLECHGDKFTSFSQNHPGYETYPYKRPTRIHFDHLNHFQTHFTKSNQTPTSLRACENCHQSDPQGELMVLTSFQQACGQCHTDQIEGTGRATAKGIAILSIPDIDTWTLSEKNITIGQWPELTDGSVTPFMEILLSNNEEYQRIKPELENIELTDLSDASPNEITAVKILLWAVKDLIWQTQRLGTSYLKSQLENTLGPLTTTEAAMLTAHLSKSVIQAAQEDWLPEVENELFLMNSGQTLTEHFKNIPTPTTTPEEEIDLGDEAILLDDEIALDNDEIDLGDEAILLDDEIALDNDSVSDPTITSKDHIAANSEDWAAIGGWYKDDNTYSLRYRPVSHGDTFLKAWLDISGSQFNEESFFADLFNILSENTSIGSCSKCHSVERFDDSRFFVNWGGASSQTQQNNLAQYSHSSHFQVMDERGCETCHQLSTALSGTESARYDSSIFDSNFAPLEQEICANCHQAETTLDTCITCHKYHFVRPQTPAPSTTLLSQKH